MNSYEDPALSYECDLTAQRDALLVALKDLFAPPSGSPGADRVDYAAAWERARKLLRELGEE